MLPPIRNVFNEQNLRICIDCYHRFDEFKTVIIKGDIESASKLCSTGFVYCDVAQDVKGTLPVHIAAYYGHILLLQFLEFNGADLYRCDRANRNTMAYAISGSQLEVVQWLFHQR